MTALGDIDIDIDTDNEPTALKKTTPASSSAHSFIFRRNYKWLQNSSKIRRRISVVLGMAAFMATTFNFASMFKFQSDSLYTLYLPPEEMAEHAVSSLLTAAGDDVPVPVSQEPATPLSSRRIRSKNTTVANIAVASQSNITKALVEKVKVSKPLSFPTEKEVGIINSIKSESKGKQEIDAASTYAADTKSDDSANPIGGAGTAPVSAPVFVSASAPTSNLSPNPERVFWCGYNTLFTALHFNLAKVLFPGVPAEEFLVDTMEFGPNDLLILTRSGPCWNWKGKRYIQDAFPGKIMYVNGEMDGPDPT
jgi:hypothetical protein